MKKMISKILCLVMCVALLAGCGTEANNSAGDSKSSEADTGKDSETSKGKYKIAVSNAYMGNDWRQLMIK